MVVVVDPWLTVIAPVAAALNPVPIASDDALCVKAAGGDGIKGRRELQSRIAFGKGNKVIVVDCRDTVVLEQTAVGDICNFEMRGRGAVDRIGGNDQTRSCLRINDRRGRGNRRRCVYVGGKRPRREWVTPVFWTQLFTESTCLLFINKRRTVEPP